MIRILKNTSGRTDTISISSHLSMIFFMKHFVSRFDIGVRAKSYLIPITQLQKYVTVEL